MFFIIATGIACQQEPTRVRKSPEEIRAMSPEQRFDEYILQNEQGNPRMDIEDRKRYGTEYDSFIVYEMRKDGQKLFPYFIEITDKYDPDNSTDSDDKRMKIVWDTIFDIDNTSVRLRASEEGNSLIQSLREQFKRRKSHGDFSKRDYASFSQYFFYNLVLNQLVGANPSPTDEQIRASLKKDYNIVLTQEELKNFIDYLVQTNAEYPRQCRYAIPNGCKNAHNYFDAFVEFNAKD